MAESAVNSKLKPLKITCTSSDCSNNLHCFRATRKLAAQGGSGNCRDCGADLIEWGRVHTLNLADVDYTFKCLRLEMIRHYFWHVPLTLRAINHARRKGRIALREFGRKQIRKLIGSGRHPREGYQTPRETSASANAVHFAQHATACCCRKCLYEWHGIPTGRALREEEIGYLTELTMRYIDARIPGLAEEGVSIPPIRRQARR
jgi:hypothetical protein